jgi:ribosomal protein S7
MAAMGFLQTTSETKSTISSIIVPETFTHSIAFGQTGCGKTTSFIYPNLENRLALGHGILLYDYKGKEHMSLKFLAQKAGRLGDVVEIAKPWGESINIIQNMDEDELDKFFDNILKHGDDNKYWQNSAKSLGQSLLRVLKAIEGFVDAMREVKPNTDEKGRIYLGFSYPARRTLQALVESCKTFEHLGAFIKNLDGVEKYIDKMIAKEVEKVLCEEADVDSKKELFKNIIAQKIHLLEVIQETKISLESFGAESNENLTQNIMGSLTAPLLSLAQNPYFSVNSFDIVKALNAGKIVVINTESLSSSAVESLNNTIMYELSKRTRSTNINPVSIFIDEFQRVVSENTDLPIDVFREAKVDLFLATQNSALLKDKLKSEKFEALMGNLTQKYYFANSNDENIESENALRELETFSYLKAEDNYLKVHKSEALYISDKEKLVVEYKYQKNREVLLNFAYHSKSEPLVLEYDARLFKERKIIATNIINSEQTLLKVANVSDMIKVEEEYERLFELKRKKLEVAEEEYHDDFLDLFAS